MYTIGESPMAIKVSCQLPINAMTSPEIKELKFIKFTLIVEEVKVLMDIQSTANLEAKVPALFYD